MTRKYPRGVARLVLGVVLFLVAIGSASVSSWWIGRDDLFKRSERLFDLETVTGGTGYDWLSRNEVAVIRPNRASDVELRAYDVMSGVGRSLHRMGAGLGTRLGRDISHGSLSPDRNWVLWHVDGTREEYVAVRLADLHTVSWKVPQTFLIWFEWMPDSERFVAVESLASESRAVVRSTTAPGRDLVLPVPNVVQAIPNGSEVLAVSLPPYSRGRFQDTSYGKSFRLDGLKITATQPASLTTPNKGDPQCWWRLSPRGDRLLWFFPTQPHRNPFFGRLSKWLFGETTSDLVTEIWTSGPDGTNKKRIGYLARPELGGQPTPTGFQWLPDGKSISFRYGHNLWRLRID